MGADHRCLSGRKQHRTSRSGAVKQIYTWPRGLSDVGHNGLSLGWTSWHASPPFWLCGQRGHVAAFKGSAQLGCWKVFVLNGRRNCHCLRNGRGIVSSCVALRIVSVAAAGTSVHGTLVLQIVPVKRNASRIGLRLLVLLRLCTWLWSPGIFVARCELVFQLVA